MGLCVLPDACLLYTSLLRAVHRRDDQIVGQVVGVFGDVETCVVVGKATGCNVLIAVGQRGIVPARRVGLVLGAVLNRGQFQDLVIGDVPVQFAGPARIRACLLYTSRCV